MPKAPATLIAFAAAFLCAAGLRAEPAVLGLARAYLGPQSTIDAIRSIHYSGTLVRSDASAPTKPVGTTELEMIFAKPLRQKLIVRGPKVTMTTVLDDYDAWDLVQDNSDPAKYKMTWLAPPDIRTLRANTWENLYYYTAPEGGSVEDKGPVTIDGVACERVDFTHGEGNVYERYFDRDTGRLVLTVRGTEEIRESGEIRVDGLRFPKVIVSSTKTSSGKVLAATATFDSIKLNEPLSPDLFSAPNLPAKGVSASPGK